jgi:hypothetical protein
MNEKPTNKIENNPDSIPTIKEVITFIESLLDEKKFETLRQCEDEHGLYLLEIKVSGENGHDEYLYIRKGRYVEGQSSDTSIHVIFFNKSGIPVSGQLVATYENKKWKMSS